MSVIGRAAKEHVYDDVTPVGVLARQSQVPEGRVPRQRRQHAGHLRDRVRAPAATDALQHVVGLGQV